MDKHIRPHRDIRARDLLVKGQSPYPISRPVGDEILHPDGRVTTWTDPATPEEMTTMPEQTAREVLGTHLYSAALGFFDGCRVRIDPGLLSVMVDAQVAALDHVGIVDTVARAARTPEGAPDAAS